MSFLDILEDYAKNHVVYICKHPEEILQVAKENEINLTVMSYEQVKSITEFKNQYNKEKALIAWIKANHIKVLNSGIKAA